MEQYFIAAASRRNIIAAAGYWYRIIFAFILVSGCLWVNTVDERTAFVIVALSSLIPGLIWIRGGAAGLPIFPLVAGMHFLYYALPIVRGNTHMQGMIFSPDQVLSAGLTVSIFLTGATLTWAACLRQRVQLVLSHDRPHNNTRLSLIIFSGLILNLVFYLATYAGWTSQLGTFFGTARQISLTAASISCFMLGYARAACNFRGTRFAFACLLVVILVSLSWGSLYLVGGIMLILSSLISYMVASKTVPLKLTIILLAIMAVLHAGKGDMRQKYWVRNTNEFANLSVVGIPNTLLEWAGKGLENVYSDTGSDQTFLERASLLQMVLYVTQASPDPKPFLMGDTYINIPAIMVPRFLYSEKVTAQVSQRQLNIYYGIQTPEAADATAIGWGLIAEAYANFGNFGALGIGLIFGLFSGWLGRLSVGASLLSFKGIISAVTLISLLNIEADLANLVSNLWQAAVASAIFLFVLRFVGRDVPAKTPAKLG